MGGGKISNPIRIHQYLVSHAIPSSRITCSLPFLPCPCPTRLLTVCVHSFHLKHLIILVDSLLAVDPLDRFFMAGLVGLPLHVLGDPRVARLLIRWCSFVLTLSNPLSGHAIYIRGCRDGAEFRPRRRRILSSEEEETDDETDEEDSLLILQRPP